VTVRRFYFPAWTADPPMAISPTEDYRLVSFVAPAGHQVVQLHRTALPVEQWGWAISGAALLLLGAASAISARNTSR
jgi:hypothetical protein